MPVPPTAFARLLKPLDRRLIAHTVAAHDGDHGVGQGANAWTCERHLKSLLFAQWAGVTSLREIVVGLAAQHRWLSHLNLRVPCRSTLADANAHRPAAVFRDIALTLIPTAARVLRRQSAALVRLLDASPIPLKGAGFPWAEANARTRGLKLHLLYDPRQRRPVWFALSSAKVDDVVAGRTVPLEPGATYIFDKGYTDYRWWSEINAAGTLFVTRRKRNAHRRLIAEQTATGADILADRLVQIGHRRPRGGAPLNPLYQVCLREIVVARPDHEHPLVLLTNDLQRPAVDIAQLYKERWDIELLFKWLKQNLKIRRFLGCSENAVRLQLYAALIAFLLLRLFHHTVAPWFPESPARLLTCLRLGLFSPVRLGPAQAPPPKPRALRPAKPQACFVV